MKIVLVFAGTTGGVPKVMLHVANGLSEWGHACTILTTTLNEKFRSSLDERVALVETGPKRARGLALDASRFLREQAPDIVIVSQQHLNLLLLALYVARAFTSKIVVCQHNTLSAVSARRPVNRVFPLLCGLLYRRADKVVCVSEGVRDDLAQLTTVPGNKLTVITNPVLRDEAQVAKSDFPGANWLSPNERALHPVIVGAGILKTQKDFGTFIQSISCLRPSVRAIIFGDGPDKEELQQLVAELNLSHRIIFAGHVENAHIYFPLADVFFLSSRWEGLPTVLIEALASGVQIVSTDCKSGPREILADGKYGILVPESDPIRAARAIEHILQTPRSEDEKAEAIAFARAEFSFGSAIEKYVSLVKEVVSI